MALWNVTHGFVFSSLKNFVQFFSGEEDKEPSFHSQFLDHVWKLRPKLKRDQCNKEAAMPQGVVLEVGQQQQQIWDRVFYVMFVLDSAVSIRSGLISAGRTTQRLK